MKIIITVGLTEDGIGHPCVKWEGASTNDPGDEDLIVACKGIIEADSKKPFLNPIERMIFVTVAEQVETTTGSKILPSD